MRKFHNILFVSHGIADETEALKQALSLARNNKAALEMLIVCPDLPREMAEYKEKYEKSLRDQLRESVESTRKILDIGEVDAPVQIKMESGDMPAIRIIWHILRNSNDLLIKEAEPKESGKGFKAIDMELLRKSPCPVWLCRPIKQHRKQIRVAVAIDPKNATQEGRNLSLRQLELSRSLADTCSGVLNIISCWDYEFEEYLRDNVWIKIEDDKLAKTVDGVCLDHRAALDCLLDGSGITDNVLIHHVRGRPDKVIPQYIEDKRIDILVMGTVARTGISGLVIGNTAENVLQKIGCSLLALKPSGFVSPAKAY